VFDPNGNPVTNFMGGIVQVTNTATTAVFKAPVSEKTGAFEIRGVPAGMYDLVAPFGGQLYQNYSQKGVVVTAGETLPMKIVLAWGMNLGTIADAPDVLTRDMARKALSMPTQPAPRMPDGKPDFTGVWVDYPQAGGGPDGRPPGLRGNVVLQPWAAEKVKQIQAAGPQGPQGNRICLPTAQPGWNHVFKFVQAPTTLIHIAEESTPGFRQIFLDGRPHPKNWNPAWQGHSIGKWEGDTLVVDTSGFNDEVQVGPIHSEQLHFVERIRRPDMAHLEVDITADDPGAWMPGSALKQTVHGVLALDQEVLEFICQENNRLPIVAAPATGAGR
jgi:hypothetical protein